MGNFGYIENKRCGCYRGRKGTNDIGEYPGQYSRCLVRHITDRQISVMEIDWLFIRLSWGEIVRANQ